MSIPEGLLALIDDGVIESVVRQLKSGKEASVFIVTVAGRQAAAKVYKNAEHRAFRQRADYVEGRRVGDSRSQRAMDRGSRFGKQQQEKQWRGSEASAMRRLHEAGVRVPRVHANADGIVIMDLVADARGEPAPQLAQVRWHRDHAVRAFHEVIRQIQLMLCAGLIHGDLSEYNILLAPDGPVIIDLPQAVEAARNSQAKRLLLRDVANIVRFFSRWAPELRRTSYGDEMWLLLEHAALTPETPLTGKHQAARHVADTAIVLREIAAAKAEAAKREEIQRARALGLPKPRR